MTDSGDGQLPAGISFRPAELDDYNAVVAFTEDTWEGYDDYIPRVYHEWVEDEDSNTLVADAGEDIAAIGQGVMLTPTEGWAQGMRVNPDYRGQGIASALTHALFRWASDQGAVVARNMVFSWNDAGLGQSRSVGFEPATSIRFLHPEPAAGELPEAVRPDVDAGWQCWTDSVERAHLGGLALDMDETWAVRELRPSMLERAAAETALLSVVDDGARGLAYRSRTLDREDDGSTETIAEYGVGVWRDLSAAKTLLEAIRIDAHRCGADRARVMVPETVQAVSDGALLRATPADHPEYVLAADLSDY